MKGIKALERYCVSGQVASNVYTKKEQAKDGKLSLGTRAY